MPQAKIIPLYTASSEMRQSANTPSLIPVPNRQKAADTLTSPPVPPKANRSIMTSGIGISVSPSRVPIRTPQDRLKSLFSSAPMVGSRSEEYAEGPVLNGAGTEAARAPNKLSDTPILGSKDEQETRSPTSSNSISPRFIIRNLDEDPHTGLTPTSNSFGLKKPVLSASRLSNSQLPSPPSSPKSSPEITRSRLPRRSKDELNFAEPSRKLQAALTVTQIPRRISIPSPLNLKPVDKSETPMTVALAPPAPITIPPNEFAVVYSSADKPIPSAKSPGGALASFFRWNTAPVEPVDRLQTPSTLSTPRSPTTPGSPSVSALEQELRHVSADLAFSIRREMDLEDVIARLQEEVARLGGEANRDDAMARTSDYFSEKSLSPPLRATDDHERRGHSRVSSVALEDVRMANEKVTQLEKEVLMLKHENLELMTLKRETERKLKDQRGRNDSNKVQELESSVEQLREQLVGKTHKIEALQESIKRNKTESDRATAEELKKMEDRAIGAESQREALQLALRQLRERQALESKRASDRIRQLEGDREKGTRTLPRTLERAVTGITYRAPDGAKRSTRKNLEETIAKLRSDLSKASEEIAALTVSKTQLASENSELRDMQQRLQSRLGQLGVSASASTIGEASATASLSYANGLAVEMARVTDLHVKSLDKVRSVTKANLPHLENGNALSPLLQSAYDVSLSSNRLSWRQTAGDQATVKMMEERIKELEGALRESSSEFGEVVRKMQLAQIEMIELAGERDEALRRERKLLNDSANVEVVNNTTETDNI